MQTTEQSISAFEVEKMMCTFEKSVLPCQLLYITFFKAMRTFLSVAKNAQGRTKILTLYTCVASSVALRKRTNFQWSAYIIC